MRMTQQCIHTHYESAWKTKSDAAGSLNDIVYSSPVEDAVVYPLYRQMIRDLKIKATAGDVLDVGAGSGRWIRFFLESFAPKTLTGVDYTQASIDLLKGWFPTSIAPQTQLEFRRVDITDPTLDLGRQFDLINIANVLFHIPETDKFANALANLSKHLLPSGMLVTTEYLPRQSMRTDWMLVRDRYTFEKLIAEAGLRIVAIKAFSVFANDPMGIDGPDTGTRGQFVKARAMLGTLAQSAKGDQSAKFVASVITEIERAVLAFCQERVQDIDMPSQKLVFLARA